MKRTATSSIQLDEDYFANKRHRIEIVGKQALRQYYGLLAFIDKVGQPRTPKDFLDLGTRLQVASEALLAVAEEAR